jgi:DNA polymerase III subunit gamma/tau
VLSRCLQFNLKNVPADTLQSHLHWVLEQEEVSAQPRALAWIASAAQGSVRDSLSLTDQAIAYGAGQVTEAAVQSMLGLVQRELLAKLLRALADHDAPETFAVMEELLTAGAGADALLADMARWFHQAAALSALKVETTDDPTGTVALLAEKMSADLLQLNYQISVLGRRDLPLAPDDRTGLEMTLLRLLAFQPSNVTASAAKPSPSLRGSEGAAAIHPSASLSAEQWPTVSRTLKVTGLAKQFVQQAELIHCEDAGRIVNCKFRVAIPALAEAAIISKAQYALAAYFGKPCKIDAQIGQATQLTAAAEDATAAQQAQSQAEKIIQADPVVQSILKDFGGAIVPGSIRPSSK